MSSISGIGAAGSANAELAMMLSKLRGTDGATGAEITKQQNSELLALAGRPEAVSQASTALTGTGKAELADQTLLYLTLMQADDGLSVGASASTDFAATASGTDLQALVSRWSEGADMFSNISTNITLGTQTTDALGAAQAGVASTVDYSFLINTDFSPSLTSEGAELAGGQSHHRTPEQELVLAMIMEMALAGGGGMPGVGANGTAGGAAAGYGAGPAATGAMADVSA